MWIPSKFGAEVDVRVELGVPIVIFELEYMIIAIVFAPWLVASGLHFLFYKLWDINQNINEWEIHFNPA